MSVEETSPDRDRDHGGPVPVVAARRPDPDRRLSRSWFSVGFRAGLGALAAYWLVLAVQHVESTLMLVPLSLVIAISADPVVGWLTGRGLRRSWAVAAVIVGLFLLLGGPDDTAGVRGSAGAGGRARG
ncbi:hypothetical protein [Actinacidiphila oryziradicis]|uniref:AI-2E family transporter n=1 Tax=Actinacidiphila oryziradicis TaxID=2571141 RepID=UPI0023F41AE3|nr:hypothetical protein [Actinacidiphila oryziradicis]MCW2871654.1 family transporter [Actinacidiphila oryziradicis]